MLFQGWHAACPPPPQTFGIQGLTHEKNLFTMLDTGAFPCYILLMLSDPYEQMDDQDHADMGAWFDNVETQSMRLGRESEEPVYNNPGQRCGCEDAPCCGC